MNNTYRHLLKRLVAAMVSAALLLAPVSSALAAPSSETRAQKAEAAKDPKVSPQKKPTSRSILNAKPASGRSNTSGLHATGGVGNGYPPLLIGPGDLLVVAVYGEAELPLEYQVDSDGIVTVPYVGNVKLGGMTPAQASEKLARLLAKPRKVTVLIKESNTYWVSVLGHVSKPGKYQIKGKPTLLSALAEAGGPMPGAKLGKTTLIHQGKRTKIDLSKFLKGDGPLPQEPLLFPGDVLNVPKSGMPSMGSIAIVASILASATVLVINLQNIKDN